MRHQPDRRALVLKLRLGIALSLAAAAAVTFIALSRPNAQSETTPARVGSNATEPASVGHGGIVSSAGRDRATEGAADGQPAPGPDSLGVSLSPPLATWLALGDAFGTSRGEGRFHAGLDFDVGSQQPIAVLASCSGPVSVDDTDDYGLRLIIACAPDVKLIYAYLGGISVETSQTVSDGQPIGLTDPSLGILHFEIRFRENAVDPTKYIEALILPPPEATVTPPPTVPRPTQRATSTPAARTGTTVPSSSTAPPPTASPTPVPTSTPTPTATQTNTPTSTSTPRTPSRGGTAVPGR